MQACGDINKQLVSMAHLLAPQTAASLSWLRPAHSAPGSALQTLLCRTECQSVTGAVSQAYWEISKKLMIVPYVPGSTDNREPLLGFQQPILPLEERQNLLFFRATCLPFLYLYPNNTRITTGKVSAVLTSCCLQTLL